MRSNTQDARSVARVAEARGLADGAHFAVAYTGLEANGNGDTRGKAHDAGNSGATCNIATAKVHSRRALPFVLLVF